jgi:WD40 repeat protein
VNSVHFSPNVQILVYSGAGDDLVQVRRSGTGALVRSFTADTEIGVDQVRFSPNGRALASVWNKVTTEGGYTFHFGGMELWDASSPPAMPSDGSHANYATCLAWAPDGLSVATGSSDRRVILWDAATGQQIRSFHHDAWIQSVAISPDGMYLASGAADNAVKIWNLQTGALVHTLTGHTDYVRTIDFSPDGTLLASGAGGFNTPDNSIKLWRVADGALLHTLTGHTEWVLEVTFAPGGAYLGSASRDGTIRFWQVGNGNEVLNFDLGGAIPMSLDIAPQGNYFAYGLNDGSVNLARP